MQYAWLVFIAIGIATAACVLLWWRRHAGHPRDDGDLAVDVQNEYLLLLLRRSAADLSTAAVETAADAAWGGRFGRKKDGTGYIEPGSSDDVILLEAHGNAFLVIRSDPLKRKLRAPDVFHPESAAELWSEYSHDVSVGVAHNYDTQARKLQAYVGSLAAALCDEHTIGLFHPNSGQAWRTDAALLERLKSNPEAFFSEGSSSSSDGPE